MVNMMDSRARLRMDIGPCPLGSPETLTEAHIYTHDSLLEVWDGAVFRSRRHEAWP